MTNLFALFPLFSIYFLIHAMRARFKVYFPVLFVSVVAVLTLGYFAGHEIVGVLYAGLFVMTGFFPSLLKHEVKKATDQHRSGERALKEQVGQSKFEREKWVGIRQRVLDEMERISKRYAFARTLVARTDEKAVLMDLSTTFGSTRRVLGLAFSTNLEKEKGEKGSWIPSFSSGWVTEEDWSKLLKKVPDLTDRASAFNLPGDSDLSEQMKSDDLHLVYASVKWGGEVQGLLTLLVEGPVSGDFLDEVSLYAQLLGLGLHKTYLYRMVVERSRRDGLTNLYLRGVFLERLNDEISFSKRYETSFSVLLLDLDHFKSINDTYGHVVGDKVLRSVAECLKNTLHPGVTIARYGGEEFAILIGLAPPEEVRAIAEQVRHAIEHLVFALSEEASSKTLRIGRRKGEIRVTVSIGISHYVSDSLQPNELIRRADAALYWAKQNGRNMVKEWKAVMK